MKSGNWIPISKAYLKYLPKSREYTKLEAGFSVQVDYDNQSLVTVAGYSALWSWSRKRVSKFLDDINVEIIYPESTKKRQNQKGEIGLQIKSRSGTDKEQIRCIENTYLQVEKNRKGADEEQIKSRSGSTTKEPKPLTLKKTYSFPENYSEQLKQSFTNFIENRIVLKKPVTDLAFTGLVNKLNKLSGGNESVALEIIEESIINGWTGFFKLKGFSKPVQEKQMYATFED
jgi:hypothetical protein